jgi:uncharacterized membrane protein
MQTLNYLLESFFSIIGLYLNYSYFVHFKIISFLLGNIREYPYATIFLAILCILILFISIAFFVRFFISFYCELPSENENETLLIFFVILGVPFLFPFLISKYVNCYIDKKKENKMFSY